MKLYFKISLLAIGLFAAVRSNAQQDTTGSFTLERCVTYAIQHSVASQNSQIDKQIAESKIKEIVGIGLPQISGAASIVNNPTLPRFFTTYHDSAHSTGGPSFIPEGIPGLKNGDVVGVKNFFQLQAAGQATITANQLIFNGSYIVGLKARSVYRELAQKNANLTREQIIVGVTKAYYLVIINRERAAMFNVNIARVDSLLKSTKAMNENGLAESIDVDRIQVQYNNLIVQRDIFLNVDELGLQVLKFQMNYPSEGNLRVEGNIMDVTIDSDLAGYQKEWDYRQRPDYQVLDANRKLQEMSVKNKYAAGMPSIYAFGTLGYQTQSSGVGGIFKTNTGINDAGGLGPDKFYRYSQVGVSVAVPIFSGLQRHQQLQQEKLNLAKVNNSYINLKNGIDLEVKTGSLQFENALKTLTAQKENMDLASRIARVTKVKYEQGVGSNIEVVDAENSLRNAQLVYYNSLFDVMVAKVDLDKAFGRILPNSPVPTE